MASNRQRRFRGGPAVAFNTRVDPTAKAKIDDMADALGKSQGQAIDLILEFVDVDAQGSVVIRGGVLGAAQDQEELPLSRSA